MIKSDNHVHTAFSTDSQAPMEDMLNKAIQMGFSSICFTDHMDYNFPPQDEDSIKKNSQDIQEFFLDMPAYQKKVKQLAGLYPQIKIRFGVELGLKDDAIEQCRQLASLYNFDFIIGSTHIVNDIDPYYDKFWQETDEKAALRRYYEATLANIKNNTDFDVYGHIDYITRYTPYMKKLRSSNSYDEAYSVSITESFLDIIEEILKQLIYNGKGIELNTSGFKYGINHPHPHEKILKLYHSLGGEIITIGSDAHETRHLGFAFDKVPGILKSCGFKYYTEFTNRRPDMLPVTD